MRPVPTAEPSTATLADADDGTFPLQVLGWYTAACAVSLIDVGHRTGLLEALADGPATSVELADRCGLSERHVREWLGGVTTSRIVDYDPASRRFTLPSAHTATLIGDSATNVAPLAQAIMHLGGFAPAVERTVREGGGIPYEAYGSEFPALQDGLNRRIYDAALVDDYLPRVDGLIERLTDGVRLLDVGCGSGHVINLMARAFPASTFLGYDLSETAISNARAEALAYGADNATFQVRDASRLPARLHVDVVTAFDAIHDQAQPRRVLAEIRRVLADDGLFVMVDMNASSALEANVGNPVAPYFYWVSLFHCLQVSLAEGGEGLGAAWGMERATELLHDAGFTGVATVPAPPQDPVNAIFVCRP